MYSSTRLGLILGCSLIATSFGLAQQEALSSSPHAGNKIVLDVVVTPKSGQPVGGLQQPEFTLLDNKVARPLTSFKALTADQAPIEVVLLVDAVNTNFQSVAYERQQIEAFLKANGGHLAHPTSLAIFTDTGTQVQDGFSTDGNALSADLDKFTIGLRDIRRSAGFYGASDRFQLSMVALRQLTAREAARPGRKILLWISPGWPLLSGPAVDLDRKQQDQIFAEVIDMSNKMRQARMTLYSVDPLGASESVLRSSYYQEFVKGVSKAGKVDLGDLGLQVLATQSGGLVLNSNNDITGELQRVMDDTKAYYEISFDAPPSDHADEYHQIQVQVGQPGLTARTRTGYYSQP
ncbi:VWA domain-containing protein [Granulicella arctica]|uniref:VWA domain-containing protein n=1 Tax=Granulicella arctica TaxID=940613 RepID=UPI0021E0A728|nr:VWA domain-containing protein [Granulicella arctica]